MQLRKKLSHLIAAVRPRRRLPVDPPIRAPEVRIIVLNWNNRDVTLRCVESLLRARLDGARILVVDNGSSDGSVDAVRGRFPDVGVLSLPENRGYAGGNNAGTRAALDDGARAVLLLNNDTEVAEDFLEPLLDVLNTRPRTAAVSSAVMRLEQPDALQEAYFEIYFGFGLIRRRGVNALPGEGFDQVKVVDAAIGCSFLTRATALRDIGLLDESYFAYHEEVEWCWRARKRGWEIVYQPYSRVWHHFSKSTDVRRPGVPKRWNRTREMELPNPLPVPWNPVRTYLGARNSIRFIARHANPLRKLYFAASTLYAIPLEVLAVVTEREEELKLGLLSYRRALYWFCIEDSGVTPGTRPTGGEVVRALLRAPLALGRSLPREIRRARAAGLTAQVEACIRGHLDGLRGRPVPLEALGLRPRPAAPAPPPSPGAAQVARP